MMPHERTRQAQIKANDRKVLVFIVTTAFVGACAIAAFVFLSILRGG